MAQRWRSEDNSMGTCSLHHMYHRDWVRLLDLNWVVALSCWHCNIQQIVIHVYCCTYHQLVLRYYTIFICMFTCLYIYVYLFALFVFWDRILPCSPGWSGLTVDQASIGLTNPPASATWVMRLKLCAHTAGSCIFLWFWEMEPQVLHILDNHTNTWVTHSYPKF